MQNLSLLFDVSDKHDYQEDIDESIIDTLPENHEVDAKKIFVLHSHAGDLVCGWGSKHSW